MRDYFALRYAVTPIGRLALRRNANLPIRIQARTNTATALHYAPYSSSSNTSHPFATSLPVPVPCSLVFQ
jgi:hypothetical protein